MTYSQLRNRLNSAFQGRNEFMREQLGRYGQEAQKRGFGINGARVSDLLFPLADAAYAAKERESLPPVADAEKAQSGATRISEAVGNVVAGAGRGLFPNYVEGASRGLEFLFGPKVDPNAGKPQMRTGGGFPVND
jgi:hypothetical protein